MRAFKERKIRKIVDRVLAGRMQANDAVNALLALAKPELDRLKELELKLLDLRNRKK